MLEGNFLIFPYLIKKPFTLRGKGPFEGQEQSTEEYIQTYEM